MSYSYNNGRVQPEFSRTLTSAKHGDCSIGLCKMCMLNQHFDILTSLCSFAGWITSGWFDSDVSETCNKITTLNIQ